MEPGRSLLFMTIVMALALGGGIALWYRAGVHGTPPAAGAEASPRAFSAAGSGGEPPSVAASSPADTTAVAGALATPDGSLSAADADQRQVAKITRGMSSAAGGGIVVTATPPGSVTGQLRLRAGDVILAVNGEAISSPEEFARLYREQGLPRELTIVRDGREIHRH